METYIQSIIPCFTIGELSRFTLRNKAQMRLSRSFPSVGNDAAKLLTLFHSTKFFLGHCRPPRELSQKVRSDTIG